jgi:hypothetical protein
MITQISINSKIHRALFKRLQIQDKRKTIKDKMDLLTKESEEVRQFIDLKQEYYLTFDVEAKLEHSINELQEQRDEEDLELATEWNSRLVSDYDNPKQTDVECEYWIAESQDHSVEAYLNAATEWGMTTISSTFGSDDSYSVNDKEDSELEIDQDE